MRLLALGALVAFMAGSAVAAGPLEITVGRGPGWVVGAGGAIWVGNHRDCTIERIDPQTGRVTRVVAIGRPGGASGELGDLGDVEATRAAVFGLNAGSKYHVLVRIDLAGGALRSTRVGTAAQPASSLVASGTRLWLSGGPTVWALDADSLATLAQADLSTLATNVTVLAPAQGGVWVGTEGERLVRLAGPALSPVANVRLFPQGYMSAAAAGNALWVAATGQRTIVRVDGRTGKRLARLRIHEAYGSDASFPTLVATGGGVFWIWRDPAHIEERSASSGALLRTLELPEVAGAGDPSDYYPGGIATAYGATWVSEWPAAFEGFRSPVRGVLLRYER